MTGETPDDAAVLEALFGNSPQGLFVLDTELRVLRYNRAGRGVSGLSEEDVLGKGVEEFAPGLEPETMQRLAKEALDTARPVRKRLVRGPSPSDPNLTLTLEMSFFPLAGARPGTPAVVTVVEDVTARQADADRFAVLSAVHASVGSTLDTPATAGELVQTLVPDFADAAAVDLLDHTGASPVNSPLRRVAFAPRKAERGREEGASRPFPFPTPYTQALNDLRARLVPVASDTEWLATSPEGFAPLVDAGVHSMIVAPLATGEGPLGLLTLYRTRREPFEDADLDVARQIAATAAAHLDNARRYRREHEAAAALHRRLQPHALPDLSAVDADYVYLPEGAGGGWFDVIPLSGTRVALVVGDVAGHGVEAAATMGQLRIALRTLTLQDLETDELLTRLDEVAAHVAETSDADVHGPVATCAVSVYDPVSRRCTMVRAGHPAPVVIEPDGTPLTVHVPEGPPLGEGGGRVFTPAVVELAPGSLLAHCTTGLFARRDRADGQDGGAPDTGLEHALAATTRPLRELCDAAVYRMAPVRGHDAVLLLARTRALPPERLAVWTLPTDASVVGTARRLAERQLAAWDLAGAAHTTELIISELVTNAIRHGEGPIQLRLIHDRGRLLAEVTDTSSASPHLRHARDSDEGGRGLYIVMRLSLRWGVRHSRQDKTIWSEQGLDGGAMDAPAGLEAFDVDQVPAL
ncbi:SpoIIE family protein phosphatase [Streptomyces sp. CNQ431]|uniref:SpoIIE family protein phosphatase n=1 Tax=Streptomyces sp. CNQ431 TaxID=1571532 RepID=UPI00053D3444|nr:SpoIIE family protein phosphatase [Streptomyces sp. CNQ431]